jgi:hypothetical protein
MLDAKSQKLHTLYDVAEFQILSSATFYFWDSACTAVHPALLSIDKITTATHQRCRSTQQHPPAVLVLAIKVA